ncbi:13345_t:CDS:10 [Funneliformis geosporum]|nr:13345_t:CDS:10 [Funneliformis geosporum]
MSKKYSDYFCKTLPENYSFLGFYKYRHQQPDFTFSYQKESRKLSSDLEELTKEDSEVVRACAGRLLQNHKFYFITALTIILDLQLHKNHREKYPDVQMFWNNLESSVASSSLQLDKVNTARTVMHGTERLIKTAFNEVDGTLKADVSNNGPKTTRECFGDEIVGEFHIQDNNQEQYRIRNGADNHADSEDSYESQDHHDLDMSNRDAIDEIDETKGAINDEGKVVEGNKTKQLRLSEANRKEIDEAYKLMDRQYMWELSSGKVIEEELYKLGRELEFEHAVHSFILDIDDELVADCFTETELREIELTPIPEVPELSDELKGNTTTNKGTKFRIDYDCEKHHDMDYICLALHALIREIESGKITEANLENWFNCHVWSMVFDHAFENIKAISVVRGESTSVSTATRKNKKTKRKSGNRRKIGRRGDWILRAVGNGDKNEFGAGEAGKSWVDQYGTKYLREGGLKLPKVLKDMLLNLREKIGWNEEARKKIQTVGIIHGGLMMTIAYLDNPMGYICRLRRSDLMEVPDMAEKFESILTILASVLNIKSVVGETIKIVQRSGQTNKSFKSAGLRKRSRNESQRHLYACMSTPKKARVCKVSTERPYPASPCPGSPNSGSLINSLAE